MIKSVSSILYDTVLRRYDVRYNLTRGHLLLDILDAITDSVVTIADVREDLQR